MIKIWLNSTFFDRLGQMRGPRRELQRRDPKVGEGSVKGPAGQETAGQAGVPGGSVARPMSTSAREIVPGPLLSFTPGALPFVNSTPAASKAKRMADRLLGDRVRRPNSKLRIVFSPRLAREPSRITDQFNN